MKIIHTADIHLGARPDPGYTWSREREQEIWNSFRRLIERVKEERADFLLVAGDLFHRQPLLRELKEVNYLFASIPETTVVLMAGNHDYLAGNSCYPGFPLEQKCYRALGRALPEGARSREGYLCLRMQLPQPGGL